MGNNKKIRVCTKGDMIIELELLMKRIQDVSKQTGINIIPSNYTLDALNYVIQMLSNLNWYQKLWNWVKNLINKLWN